MVGPFPTIVLESAINDSVLPFQADILAETHNLVPEGSFWYEVYTHGNRLNEQKGVPMPIVRYRCTTLDLLT